MEHEYSLNGPGELIAAIPGLLGFHPSESLVVVGVLPRGRVGVLVRVDRADCLVDDIAAPLARSVVAQLARDGAVGAVILSYTDHDVRLACPAADAIRGSISDIAADVEVWAVSRGGYFAPGCASETCCPAGGRAIPHLAAVPRLGARVVNTRHGHAAARPEAEYRVSAEDRRRSRRAEARWRARRDRDGDAWRVASFELWMAAARGAEQGLLPEAPLAGRLIAALQDPRVRDAALISMLPGRRRTAHAVAAGTGDDDVAVALQTLLSTKTGKPPRPEAVRPVWELCAWLAALADAGRTAPMLTLCAVIAWWEGDEDASRDMLDRVHHAEPEYRLAGLLECTMLAGITPGWRRVA